MCCSFAAWITPFGNRRAVHDAAKNIHQDRLHFRIGEDDPEPFRHFFFRGAPAHIEKIRGRAAIELDDIHRRHRKPCAIDHAADIAMHRDVGQIVLFRSRLLRRHLASDRKMRRSPLAKERIVIDAQFRIERDDLVLAAF